MSKYENVFMEKAFKQAELAYAKQEVPVGCVFVYRGNVIGRGHNLVNVTKNPTRHAEMVAFDEVREYCNLEGLDVASIVGELELFVTLEPCIMCASAMIQLGIKEITYAASNERFGGMTSCSSIDNYGRRAPNFKFNPNVDEERSIEMLRKFYDRENVAAPEEKRKLKKTK
uniref:CMP/dCMP-type deaminase domain-containing protein n=1 Tax=Rhabditophanes sp. KR3021 TaxID=114890 RepID=A0AC35UCU3_9BILA